MNTQQNIQQLQGLHCQAVATLGMLRMCQCINDQWGVRYYSRQYDKILEQLRAMPKLEQPDESYLTDTDTEYLFNNAPKPELSKDMTVHANGYNFFNPESE